MADLTQDVTTKLILDASGYLEGIKKADAAAQAAATKEKGYADASKKRFDESGDAALQEAKALGDVLILGLNADESVSRLKGPNRPLQNQDDRAFILAGLSCVDYVVVFPEDTPLDLIKAVRPHVLVKGNDWTPDKIVGAKETESWGGEVTTIPLLDGRSTTSLVAKSRLNQ